MTNAEKLQRIADDTSFVVTVNDEGAAVIWSTSPNAPTQLSKCQ